MEARVSMEKVALITGGAKGIGAACASILGEAGYKIAVHFRSDPSAAETLCKSLPEAQMFQFDLAQKGSCEDLFKDVKKAFGRVDVLVNNAGHAIDQIIPFAKADDFENLININLKPVFMLSKLCSKQMIKQKTGSIINITSVVGHSGNPGQSMYAATKSAITGFTKSIALELAPYGIRCNCLAPGFIQTNMTAALDEKIKEALLKKIPLGRFGETQEVAGVVKFLASSEASYVTGSTIHVNGGMYTS